MLRLLPPPAMPPYADDFGDGALDARLVSGGTSGAVAEGGGVLNIGVDAGGAWRTRFAFALVAAGDTRAEATIAAEHFAAYAAGAQWGALALSDPGGENYDMIGLMRAGAGDVLGYQRARDGVVTHFETFALPALPLRLRLLKDGSRIRAFAQSAGDDPVLRGTSTDFGGSLAPALTVSSDEADAMSIDFDDLVVAPDFAVTRINHLVMGCHLNNVIVIEGRGFAEDLLAAVADEEAVDVVVESSTRAIVTGPVFRSGGERRLRLFYQIDPDSGVNIPLVYSDVGYTLRRAEEPQGRYTAPHANPRSIWLALLGQADDRIHHAATDFIQIEIHAHKTQQCIELHENLYGVRPADGDTIADRRARVMLRRIARPSMRVSALSAIVNVALPGRGVVENAGIDTWGDRIWQFQAYENAPNELSTSTHAELSQMLNACGPGHARARVGHRGFILDASRLGRDFLSTPGEA